MYSEAALDYEQGFEPGYEDIDAQKSHAYSVYGTALYGTGSYEDAISSLGKVIELTSNKHNDFNSNACENYYYIKSSYYYLNDEESALNYFNKAIEINSQAEDVVDFRDYLLNK